MKTLTLLCLATLFATNLPAQTVTPIVSEGYSFPGSGDGSVQSMNNRTPDGADLPGTPWTVATLSFEGFYSYAAGGVYAPAGSGRAYVGLTGFNTSTSINIASTGSYTKPSILLLSLDVCTYTLEEDDQTYARGIGLGFFTSTPMDDTEARIGFTGLDVAPDGTLYLEINGARTNTGAPGPGDFSTNNFYTLSYQLDTTTGLLTKVIYDGVDDSDYFAGVPTGLTDTNTNLVGYYGSSANDAEAYGEVGNFLVGAVPEPSTWAMLGLGAVGAGVVVLRQRHRANA